MWVGEEKEIEGELSKPNKYTSSLWVEFKGHYNGCRPCEEKDSSSLSTPVNEREWWLESFLLASSKPLPILSVAFNHWKGGVNSPSIEVMKILAKIRPKNLISRDFTWLFRGISDCSMQKVIPQARPHHSCVPCQCFYREDDLAKRTLELKTTVSVNIRSMKPMSRAQKYHNEVECTNQSCSWDVDQVPNSLLDNVEAERFFSTWTQWKR